MRFLRSHRHRTRSRKISWFSVWDLPKDRSDEESCARLGLAPNNLYTVLPFVNDIQAFVRKEHAKRQSNAPRVEIGQKSSSAFQPVVPKGECELAAFNKQKRAVQLAKLSNRPMPVSRSLTSTR